MTKKANTLLATNEDTVGPYYPIYFADEMYEDISRIHHGVSVKPEGQAIELTGRLIDHDGNLANGVVMEFWQANAKGVYRTPATVDDPHLDPWFDGFGRVRTADGHYRFRTIMPGAAPGRAPNITITLFSDGISRIVTQVFFEGEAGHQSDPLLVSLPAPERDKLIARKTTTTTGARGSRVYQFDIVMAGKNETPFFDDFES
ncbi:MAG: protocatechuate 3,4-dioxygenase subunit alpha [Pseudomonadota bacterium]